MQWLALANWILVTMLALGSAAVPLPSLGVQAMCSLAGLGTMIVFAAGGGTGFAWASFGCACVGSVCGAFGSRALVDDSSAIMQGVLQGRKEMAAGLQGAALPFMVVAIPLSLAVALG